MNLSHNSLNGTLAPGLAKLSSLEVLDLCFNNLGGTIPPSLGDLGMLRYLNVSFNNLTGTVLTTGALGKFGADSFAGNPGLCGAKLQSSLCEPNPPTDRKPQVIPVNSGYGKYEKNPDFGANAKIAIVVLGGVFTLVLLFSIIVCCVCSVRRAPYTQRSGAEAERSHSLGLDMVPSVRNARLEVYVQGMSANYETIVSHAGYFDTAHVIGKGRFATVYLSSMSGDKPLAVKVFNDPIAPEIFEEGMARLHGMAENVPVLLPIKGYYSSPVETAIFFDFMPNGSLFDVLQTSPALLDWGERIRIAVVVSEAVDQLHRSSPSRVVHQDLKSTNIVLDKDLKPYLADYCLMELLQRSVVETPGYTPPEFTCSSFSTRRYTEKSDVYSFGVILLELLTGKHPIADDRRTSSSFHKYRGVQAQAQPSSIDVSDEENDRSFDAELGLGGNLRLVTLVLAMEREGRVAELLSSIVRKTCPSPDYQIQAFELAIRCIDEESSSRPSMSEIATILKMLANPSKA
ncbi:hypothetical protein KP509_07G037900 [Ceratopteris richardii]|uniref:Protein kinase domain-containing protein n=1 Tax=Ceratopteris richardii TaxID=49495 RepID=A0A8T2UDK6_CERRI|nr:hypothetical protein KP509_07G037900 [Ceratopteris richardii]